LKVPEQYLQGWIAFKAITFSYRLFRKLKSFPCKLDCMKKLVVIFLFLGRVACAQSEPFLPVQGFALESSTTTAAYGANSPNANYEFTQWGDTGLDMQAFSGDSEHAIATGPWSRVEVTNGSESIFQTGNGYSTNGGLACTTASGGSPEFDVYVQPMGKALNKTYYSNKNTFPSLAHLSSLYTIGTLQVVNEGPIAQPKCYANQANFAYQLMLIDTQTSPEQMLWYSVRLAHFCAANPAEPVDSFYENCEVDSPHAEWFWSGAAGPNPHLTKDKNGNVKIVNFGVTDSSLYYGQNEITQTSSPATTFTLSFLPNISAIIRSGANGIDPNLNNWKLSGFCYGQSLWGGVYYQTNFNGFGLNW